jgi:hypothetical protein
MPGYESCFFWYAGSKPSFFQMTRHVRIPGRVRIVRHHHHRLVEAFIQPLQYLQGLFGDFRNSQLGG